VLASFVYTLDAVGRRIAVDELGGRRVEYVYDGLGRLMNERVLVGGSETRSTGFDYDRAGNLREFKYAAGGGESYAYDANDRLTTRSVSQLTGSIGTSWFVNSTYDAAGNLLQEVKSGFGQSGTNTYAWDAAGRLTQTTVEGTTTTYGYNADGLRISQTTGGVTTKYLIDETEAYDQVIEEYTGGVLAATYVRGLDLLFQDRGGIRSFVVKDGLGSIRALTNTATPVAVTDTFTYDPYGQETARTGSTVLPYRFAGGNRSRVGA
jgi:YD repeat-containing protein